MLTPLKIFIIYAREDESFKNGLLTAFVPLRRAGTVEVFHDALIQPGDRWEEVILNHLRSADIILPLISSDFFASDFIHEVEFKNAVERYNLGVTVIIPIIVKHCGWKYDPLIKTLQALPRDGKPVVSWAYPDEAWEQVLDAVFAESERVAEKREKVEKETAARRKRDAEEAIRQFNLGWEATDLQEQIQCYSEAIRLNPEYADAYFNRGIAKQGLNQYADAIKDYDKVIEINPGDADAYINRGIAKQDLKQYAAAIKDYDKAIEINPENENAYNNRGLAKHILKQYEDAIKDYDKAIEINPHADAYVNRGRVKYHLNQYAAAIKDFDKAIEINSKHSFAYRNRGLSKENIGLLTEARADYQKALIINPNFELVKINLKIVEAKLKQG